jgi:chromosome segregation ATPase
MKNTSIIFLIVLLGLSLTACNRGKVKELESKNQQLSQLNQLQDSLLNDFLSYFNDFEDNLAAIKEREGIISVTATDPEVEGDRKERINEDLRTIDELLARNNNIIDSLSAKLSNVEGKSGEYRRAVNRLKGQLEEKTNTIAQLQNDLENMNLTVATLTLKVDTLTEVRNTLAAKSEAQSRTIQDQSSRIAEQSDKIAFQTQALNTAYFVTGTKRELKDAKVIDSEGGLIGIGATKKLAENFDPGSFQKIDITTLEEIPVNSRKAELLTTHPADSYAFTEEGKDIQSLKITDPSRFWSTSKYLVVVVN